MKKTIVYLISGIGIGQVVYLAMILLMGVATQKGSQMVVVTACSSLMGLSSYVYELKMAPRLRQLLHLSLIFLWVSLMMTLNGWFTEVNFLFFFIEFLVIYLVISFVIFQYEKQQTRRINLKLSELRK
ncbi:DUF3021 domain-containing protein [Streptococcus sp. S784/96/1]|uniref:DUF3021 domain-containing protein n=1 Tax=Streptococcus sp. S784/96/1 TaxID=2653499 RepID=UPI0013869B16|nr:DUF3021 domain-containing protein [Streptococcus sp. S784/96/1]